MDSDAFKRLRERAIALHDEQPKNGRISLDAIFAALVAEENAKQSGAEAKKPASGGRQKLADKAPEPWFTDTLGRLKGTGEAVTAGRFLLLAGRFPATRADTLLVSRWLREAGYEPRMSGGQQLFDM